MKAPGKPKLVSRHAWAKHQKLTAAGPRKRRPAPQPLPLPQTSGW